MAENMENITADTASVPEANPSQGFDELLRDKDFQSEFDRRVSRALETARGKWAQETNRRIEQARREEQHIARLNSDERCSAEYAQREAELMERESRLRERELRADALKMLSERGLPPELAGAINYSGEEMMQKSIESAELAFRAAVQAGVEQRMRGTAPLSAHKGAGKDVGDAEYYRSRYSGPFIR